MNHIIQPLDLLKKRYQILRSLNPTGSGQIFLARDLQAFPSLVCILQQSGLKDPQQFQNLVKALETIGHYPQVPALIDALEAAGRFYIVQEFVEGTNLENYLTEQGLFQPRQIRQLLAEILPILSIVHQHQIIHGDLKPTSLIYPKVVAIPTRPQTPHPKPMLVDFGTARLINDPTPFAAHPGYAAPELLSGTAGYSSDLYSLGITCLHLLTGIAPFNLIDLELPEIADQPLGYILKRLVSRDLAERFGSAEAVLQEMQQRGMLDRRTGLKTQAASPPWHSYATLTRQQVGLFGAINTVAISPGGQLIATGSDDQTICLWKLDTGQLLDTLTGHSGAVKSLAFSPDGQWLASGSADGSVKLWETNTWQVAQTLKGQEQAVNAVAFHPNGQQLATGGVDTTVSLWNVQTGEVTAALTGHRLAITAIAYHPTLNQLATASLDCTVKVWDVITQGLLYTMTAHTRAVRAIAFSPNGNLLGTGGDDNQILLWNLATHQLEGRPLEHSWAVTTLTFAPDGHTLISGSWDKTVRLWHMPNSQLMSILKGHTDLINSVAVHPWRQMFASVGKDQTVRLWLKESADSRMKGCIPVLQDWDAP